jgi:uncharacterized repeat protein (TIGR02543 family)
MNLAGNGTQDLTIIIDKAAGAAVGGAPTKNSTSHNSVTLNTVGINGANPGEQTPEYAKNTENTAPSTGWQDGTKFIGLSPNTEYYFFARAKENNNYTAGAALGGTSITTDPLSPDAVEEVTVQSYPAQPLNTYKHGDTLNLTGLVLTVGYDDETTAEIGAPWDDVTFKIGGNTITSAETLSLLTHQGKLLTATYGGKTAEIGTLTIGKTAQTQTIAPTLSAKTDTSVTLAHIPGAEYAIGDNPSDWKNIPDFTGLTPNTAYTFSARLAETATHNAGAAQTLQVTTLYPVTVTFDLQGGTAVTPNPQNKLSGQTVDEVTGTTKTGHTFAGWYSQAEGKGREYTLGAGGTKLSEDTGVILDGAAGTITLYAKWTEITAEWVFEDGAWKYLVGGEAVTGWIHDGKAWYYLNKDGIMQTGWLYDNNYKAWFYFAGNGAMKTGWVKDNGTWYYLAGNGEMKTGWLYDNNYKAWFYLGGDGKMKIGWTKIDGSWRYFAGNGKMLTGKQNIGGKIYSFKGNGVWMG